MANNLNYKVGLSGSQAVKGINSMKNSLTTLGRTTKTTSKEMGGFYSQLRKTNNQFSNMTKDANRASNSIGKLSKSFGALNMAIGTGKLVLIGNIIGKAIESAIDMVEVTNLFAVSLGEATDSAGELVTQMSDAFGLDPTNLKSSIGTFALLSRSMGINAENSEILSTNMAKLALDLSSLNNVPINQVMGDLRSGLVGQSETVYKYGIDVTEASLKTEAMNQGITKSVRNMSQGEKMALRYSVMLRQSSLAHGDFARTLETPANQLKILGERMVSLSRAIGSLFIPVLGMVLPYINAFVAVLTKAINSLAILFGFEMPKIDYSSVSNIEGAANDAGDAVDGMAKKIKNVSSGMDELNVISPASESGGSDSGVSAGDPNAFDFGSYDNLMNQVGGKAKELEAQMSQIFGNIALSLKPLTDALLPLSANIGDGLLFFYENILKPIGEWAITSLAPTVIGALAHAIELFGALVETTKPALSWLYENFLKPMSELAMESVELAIANLGDSFEKMGGFVKDNNEFFENFFMILAQILAPLAAFATGMAIAWGVVKIGGIVFAALTSPIGLVILAIGALITAGAWLMTHWEQVKFFADGVWRTIKETVSNSLKNVTEFIGTFIGSAIIAWVLFKDSITQIMINIKLAIIGAFTSAKDGVWNVLLIIVSLVSNILTQIKVTVSNIVTGIKDAIVNGFKFAISTVEGAFTGFKNGLKIIWDGITGIITTAVDKIKGIIKGVTDAISSALSFVADLANVSVPEIKVGTEKGKPVNANSSKFKVPKLASGGSLEGGQLFSAGEFGKAEMIGSYNGKTTVMPLEDSGFITAMYNAVYSAMSASTQNGGSVVENVITLDGEVIYKNQKEVERRRGRDFGMGVFTR